LAFGKFYFTFVILASSPSDDLPIFFRRRWPSAKNSNERKIERIPKTTAALFILVDVLQMTLWDISWNFTEVFGNSTSSVQLLV